MEFTAKQCLYFWVPSFKGAAENVIYTKILPNFIDVWSKTWKIRMEKTESDNIKEIFACEYRKNTKWRVKKKHIMLLKDARRGQNNMKTHVKFITEVVNWYIKCFAYMQNIWSSPNDLKSRCWFLKIGSVMKLRYCKVSHHWISVWVPCPAWPVAENHSCHGRNRSESETCEEKYLQSCF